MLACRWASVSSARPELLVQYVCHHKPHDPAPSGADISYSTLDIARSTFFRDFATLRSFGDRRHALVGHAARCKLLKRYTILIFPLHLLQTLLRIRYVP
jgi:hypothetical protein